jgi:predicted NUDIX family NTP pyrophosphohydrolase
MAEISAGLLMFRRRESLEGPSTPEVFIVHPGGPYFKNQDEGAWTIPKGLVKPGEDLLLAAKREFEEETGIKPIGAMLFLGTVRLKSGKIIHGWAFEYDIWEEIVVKSNYFTMESPPNSGRMQSFPEVDRGAFFSIEEAKKKLNPAQAPFVDLLMQVLPQF